ncbi:MAG: hypothetical protein LUO82_02405 [Methanomicrobiales archaeon]|nr:hypothetical protein [Methanomicrobiales archaeon]
MSLLKDILLVIAFLFTNPFVPDWGLQLIVATAIGMLLPELIVSPLDRTISRIPGVPRFKSFLAKNRRLQQIIPRIIAGYVVTYFIGWTSLVIALFLS